MASTYSIEIDCAPFQPRPSVYFSNMCIACLLDTTWFNEPTKSFGNWEWTVKPQHINDYLPKRPAVRDHLTSLYQNNSVRYASW